MAFSWCVDLVFVGFVAWCLWYWVSVMECYGKRRYTHGSLILRSSTEAASTTASAIGAAKVEVMDSRDAAA